MNLLQQKVYSRSNPNPNCISSASIDHQRYLVYGIKNYAEIYSLETHRLIQTLRSSNQDVVTAVSMDQKTGNVALAFGPAILIFECKISSDSEDSSYISNKIVSWIFSVELLLSYPCTVLEWSKTGYDYLLFAGKELSIWEFVITEEQAEKKGTLDKTNNLEVKNEIEKNDEDNLGYSRGEWVQRWQLLLANIINKAEFSPDSKFFATHSNGDKFVKVWFPAKNDSQIHTSWNFLYLAHPQPVNFFEWRSVPDVHVCSEFQPNIILTTSLDNVCRLYCEVECANKTAAINTDIYATFKFELHAIIDPAEFPSSMITQHNPHPLPGTPIVSFTSSTKKTLPQKLENRLSSSSDSFNYLKNGIIDYRHPCPLHFLNSKELFKTIASREESELKFLNRRKNKNASSIAAMAARRNKILFDTFREYPDILFHVNQDGTIVFWGVQHLVSAPKRSAKVRVIMKTQMAVSIDDCDSFSNGTLLMFQNESYKKSAIYFPSKLQILTYSPTYSGGILKIFSINIDDFFAPAIDGKNNDTEGACLVLSNSWCGHQEKILHVVKKFELGLNLSKVPSLILTSDEKNLCIIWKVDMPKIGSEISSNGLNLYSTICLDEKYNDKLLFNWLPIGNNLIIYDGTKISLWHVHGSKSIKNETCSGSSLIVDFSDFDSSNHFSFLHSYIVEGENYLSKMDLSTDEESKLSLEILVVHVIAISFENRQVYVWELGFSFGKLIHHKLLSKSVLPADSCKSAKIMHAASADDLTTMIFPNIYETMSSMKDDIMSSFEGSFLFITLESDGFCRYWELKGSSDVENEWVKLLDTFNIQIYLNNLDSTFDVSSVVLMKTNPFGKMVLGNYCSINNRLFMVLVQKKNSVSYNLSVWENSESGLTMKVDCDPIVDADWYLSSDGQHLLVCATVGRAYIYCQQRLSSSNDQSLWVCISDITLPLDEVISSVKWLVNGNILVTSGASISVFEKWMRKFDDDGMDFSPPANIFAVASKINGRLPDHHPHLLTQYLLWGQHDTAKHLLFLLYRFVKLTVDAGGTFTDVPVPLLRLLQEKDLTKISLPNISSIDQMNLLALIDTVLQIDKQKRSLDENGVRYLLAMRIYMFSVRSFPTMKVAELQTRDIAWAFYSDSQDTLIDICNAANDNKLIWKSAKALGIGLWLKNSDSLVGHPEQQMMIKFLGNDFREEKWKKAALKNAFALLGKQRYEYAVAFFILGEAIQDAINVCLKQLNDYQLAIIVCRIYEGDESPILIDIIKEYIIPQSIKSGDRWILSMAFSLLKDKSKAVLATVMPFESLVDKAVMEKLDKKSDVFTDPSMVILYQHLQKTYKSLRIEKVFVSVDVECDFIYRSAYSYERMGCPALALKIIQKSPLSTLKFVENNVSTEHGNDLETHSNEGDLKKSLNRTELVTSASNEIDWSEPVTRASNDVDWSEPLSTNYKSEINWGEPISTQSNIDFDWSEPVSTIDKVDEIDEYEAFKKSLNLEEEDMDYGDDEDTDLKRDQSLEKEKAVDVAKKPFSQEDLVSLDKGTFLKVKVQKKYMFWYKWQLAMKILQAIFNSASIVSKHFDVLKSDELFNNYFEEVRQGIRILCQLVQIPLPFMNKMLDLRCREMDSVVAYVEILPLNEEIKDTEIFLSSFLVDITNTLTRIPFSKESKLEHNLEDMKFLSTLSRRILWALTRWQEKYPQSITTLSKVAPMASATSFIVLTLTVLYQKKYENLWWMVAFSERFFEILSFSPNATDLISIIKEIIEDRTDKQVEDEDSIVNDIEEENLHKYVVKNAETERTAKLLIETISFMSVGLMFEAYLKHLREVDHSNEEDTSRIVLCDRLMKSISVTIFQMQEELGFYWKKYGPFNADELHYLVTDPSLKRILTFFASSLTNLIELALPLDPEVVLDSEIAPSEKKNYETIYRIADIIGSFAVNPLDHNLLALATFKGIVEVDVVMALRYYERKGSFTEISSSKDDIALCKLATNVGPPDMAPSKSQNSNFAHSISYESIQTAKSSFSKEGQLKLKKLGHSIQNIDNGLKIRRNIPSISTLESHPTLNYYLGALNDPNTHDCVVNLYQYGQEKDLVQYETGGTGRVSQIRFDPFGARFGACDSKGDLYLWKFDFCPQSLIPYKSFNCHSSLCHDFSFLSSSTVLATAGLSMNFNNVCIWDTLLPPSKSKIKAFAVNETGSYSLVYSKRHNLIFSGGKKGDIAVIDVRQRQCMFSFPAHLKTIKTLCIDQSSGSLISGATDGLVKVWDIQSMMSLISTTNATPSSFNMNLISKTLTPPDELKNSPLAVIQIVNVEDGKIFIGDSGGDKPSISLLIFIDLNITIIQLTILLSGFVLKAKNSNINLNSAFHSDRRSIMNSSSQSSHANISNNVDDDNVETELYPDVFSSQPVMEIDVQRRFYGLMHGFSYHPLSSVL
ncbi:regulator of (H+)-ATPase in vacuolar membrane [Clydaea vesicula]|uniref:Regulator of (H+)-ATPase in vacuolar membrane n=1 Tax=Clydaea vesicula TaxID=447962 RepID=A0AAD5Y2D1_9FUNG|nr:regulator of (H+)-ATPase in vacuolar membrane [Clydaea vesicula]